MYSLCSTTAATIVILEPLKQQHSGLDLSVLIKHLTWKMQDPSLQLIRIQRVHNARTNISMWSRQVSNGKKLNCEKLSMYKMYIDQ